MAKFLEKSRWYRAYKELAHQGKLQLPEYERVSDIHYALWVFQKYLKALRMKMESSWLNQASCSVVTLIVTSELWVQTNFMIYEALIKYLKNWTDRIL